MSAMLDLWEPPRAWRGGCRSVLSPPVSLFTVRPVLESAFVHGHQGYGAGIENPERNED